MSEGHGHFEFELEHIPILGGAIEWLESEDVDFGMIVAIIGLVIVFGVLYFAGVSQYKMITFLFASSPLWLPYLSFKIFFAKYMDMVGKKFTVNSGRSVFEIRLPAEVTKSPEAMEFVFTQIFNAATPDNLMETYLDGKRPLPYTFELVSRGGDVHFYVTLPNKFVFGLTDNLYAQYPGVEVVKQEIDYTAEIPHNLKGWSFMSFHFNKKKDSIYPIKTYIEFGMTNLPKEEEKVDPMTPMLEMLAGIKPNQQLWIQFVCIAHRDKNFKLGQLKAAGTWEGEIMAKVNDIMKRDKDRRSPMGPEGTVVLTTGEKDMVETMERMAGKYAYEFACRVVYLSNKERDYDGGLFSRMIRSFAQTEIRGRNGLGVKWRTDFNYKMLSDPFGKIIPHLKEEELVDYKLRRFTPHGGGDGMKIISVEELATIFHLPGRVAMTPTLNRVPSTRGEAPSNLPVGNLPI